MIVSLVSHYNRPTALARSLPQIVALGWPCLVVDDHSEPALAEYVAKLCEEHGALLLRMPSNRGLACALNAGLAFWLADPAVTRISYAQDDTEFAPDACEVLEDAVRQYSGTYPLLTGHDAGEHGAYSILPDVFHGRRLKLKNNARATHLLATREYWESMLPIPTRKLHAPCREPGQERGTGSDVDFWITQRAPNSIVKQGGHVLCIPGLVRTFLWRKEESSWDNEQRAGADREFTS